MSVSTDKDSDELRVTSYELRKNSKLRISVVRRFVLFSTLALFLLQFVRVKILVGGLTGSLALWSINLIDVFAYLDSLAASMSFTSQSFLALLPVVIIYLIFGRAFCGWVCPMDFLFELIGKIKNSIQRSAVSTQQKPAKPKLITHNSKLMTLYAGYGIAVALLLISALIGVPFFTRYLSHLTNFFTFINSGVYLALGLPSDTRVLIFSGTLILSLLLLEYFFPRLYCRVLCPVGKTYGLFNKISLLKLKFTEGNCGECNLCEQVCYMKVRITPYLDQPFLRDTNCIYCGKCVEGCGTKGKLVQMKVMK